MAISPTEIFLLYIAENVQHMYELWVFLHFEDFFFLKVSQLLMNPNLTDVNWKQPQLNKLDSMRKLLYLHAVAKETC